MANLNFPFPSKGEHKGAAAAAQPIDTSPDMNNMRLYDVLDNRARGGQRPGLDKWGAGTPNQIGGAAAPIIAICSVTVVD